MKGFRKKSRGERAAHQVLAVNRAPLRGQSSHGNNFLDIGFSGVSSQGSSQGSVLAW